MRPQRIPNDGPQIAVLLPGDRAARLDQVGRDPRLQPPTLFYPQLGTVRLDASLGGHILLHVSNWFGN